MTAPISSKAISSQSDSSQSNSSILSVKGATRRFGGLIAGFTLMLLHLIAIPIDRTSVNPARSIGTALFAETSTGALEQLWVFIVFPLVGAIVGVVLFLILDDTRLEDTMLAEVPGLDDVRDAFDKVADEAVEAVEDVVD